MIHISVSRPSWMIAHTSTVDVRSSKHKTFLRTACAAILCAILALTGGALRAQEVSGTDVGSDESYAQRVPGTVYVQFREGYVPEGAKKSSAPRRNTDPVQKIFNRIGVTSIQPFDRMAWKDSISHSLGIDRIYVVNYSTDAAPLDVTIKLLQTGLVQTASPRYIFKVQGIVPNDTYYDTEYYAKIIGMPDAWNITMGDTSVIIADVDEGVNYNHEDLKDNIKYFTGHDHPGFPNDYRGWDAAGDGTGGNPIPDNNPYPSMTLGGIAGESSHGTNTTGCFGMVINNRTGGSGVAPKCKILCVKIGNANGQLIAGYEGVHYAAVAGAKVINCSWGGRADPAALPFAYIFPQEVTARGEVMVAAAGNYHMNNDKTPFVPACIPGVLSVGASDENDNPTSFTHWGHIVSVFAPGINIMTTDISKNAGDTLSNNLYTPIGDLIAGTSFSSPITAGLVGLVMSKFPKLSPDAVKARIISTCDPMKGAALGNSYLFHGRINAFTALNAPGHPSIVVKALQAAGQDSLDIVGKRTTLSVTFQNGGDPGVNLTAELQPGSGYTWDQFDPNFHGLWPKANIGNLDSQLTITLGVQNVERSGQFSEGFAPLRFAVYDGSGYNDTLTVQVPLTKKVGMKHKLLSGHATTVKQVDAKIGWAGYGYFLSYYDPEKRQTQVVQVSQFSKRDPDGTWSAPQDIATGDKPISTCDAIDANTAWFGGADPTGQASIFSTTDGGTFSETNVSSTPRIIHFADANHGIFIGKAGDRWQTQVTLDGGTNWSAGASSPLSNDTTFNNAGFFHGLRGWFGSSQGRVYLTTNGGQSWNPISISGTAKQKNVMAVGFADDDKNGYAAVRDYGPNPDSAGLFYSQSNGTSWSKYLKAPVGFIPFSIAFIPGTTTAVITSNFGIFQLKSPTDSLQFQGYPSSWESNNSVISAAGSASNYTISAVSENSGIVDYTVGTAAVQPAKEISTSANGLVLSNSPNPFATSTTLYFSLAKEDHVRIRLQDVLGRTVSEVYDGLLSEGPHEIPVSSDDLARGVYHVAVETGNGDRAETSIVLMK